MKKQSTAKKGKVAKALPNPYLKKLGARVKYLRVKKGYSSGEKFALDHGFSRVQYGRWETGKNLTFLSIVQMIDAFDITVKEFFSEGFD